MESEAYWSERYLANQTGWDIGSVSTPLKEYIDQLQDKSTKVLVPGCGNGYEVEYLWHQGFKNVFVVDISSIPLKNLHNRVPDMPEAQLIHGNFFELEDTFDIILEQTFFSTFAPAEREIYADKMWHLLKPGGKLVGVLFNVSLNTDQPPYGGEKKDYLPVFSHFQVQTMDPCYNSIPPRKDSELFVVLRKPKTKE